MEFCNPGMPVTREKPTQELASPVVPFYTDASIGRWWRARGHLRPGNGKGMMNVKFVAACGAVAFLVSGCVQQPAGPTVAVMPAPYKPFEVFQQDQAQCMQYGTQMVAGGATAANNQAVGTAAVGTVLGAGLGAAAGGGAGAAIGAASGAVAGTAVAAGPAYADQGSLQQRYNLAYSQCMYAKGNQVPGFTAPSMPPPPPPPSQ
jgi:hypothetical protein